MLAGDFFRRLIAHEAAERQVDLGDDLAVPHENEATLPHGLDSREHVRRVVSHHADIMRIVSDGARDGPARDGKTAHPTLADVLSRQPRARRPAAVHAGPLCRDAAAMTLNEHDAAQALIRFRMRRAGDGVAGKHVDDGLAGAKFIGKDIE
ncbi:Uncharacterised protein [Collinsella intestinalis]|nr:Uncharacterised protein [Collinsella intestinalis]